MVILGFALPSAGNETGVSPVVQTDPHLRTLASQIYLRTELAGKLFAPSLGSGAVAPFKGTDGLDRGRITIHKGFVAKNGGAISGRLTDEETGVGLASVMVGVIPANFVTSMFLFTDAEGYYRTEMNLPPGDYIVATRNTLGYHDEVYDDLPFPGIDISTDADLVKVEAGIETSGIDLQLSPGWARISGRVIEEGTGEPVVEIGVLVHNTSGSYVGWGVTDNDGYYTTMSGLAPGNYVVSTGFAQGCYGEVYDNVRCEADGCDRSQGTVLTIANGAHRQGIDFALTPGARIKGRVFDKDDGAPVVDATVYFYPNEGRFSTTSRTDSNGNYVSSKPLDPGIYYLKLRNTSGFINQAYSERNCNYGCSSLGGDIVNLATGETKEGIDFPLTAGGTISGVVVDGETELIIPYEFVYVYDASGNKAAFGKTDHSGTYRSNGGLEPGSYYVKTRNGSGYLDEAFDDHLCGEECDPSEVGDTIQVSVAGDYAGVDFTLMPGPKISGTIRDSVTGDPLASVTIDIYDDAGRKVTYDVSDEEGTWESRTGLLAGNYYLRTSNWIGYRDQIWQDIECVGQCDVRTGTPVEISEDGSDVEGIDFNLEPGERISGRVTDKATGEPVEARVAVYDLELDWVTYAYTDWNGDYVTRLPLARVY